MTSEEARRILGIARGCDAEGLRAAFNRVVKAAHPDGGGSDEALRRTVEAYRHLETRLLAGLSDDEAIDVGALPPRIEITPSQAVIGGRLLTRLADGRRVTLNLPAGLRQGDKLKVKGALHAVHIRGRSDMFVSGDDLCLTIKARPETLRDGGRVRIKTPDGVRTVWVPKQTAPSQIVRIAGQGLPATERYPRGSLLLKVVAERTSKPSAAQTKRTGFASAWAKVRGAR